jgi:hypothetical protein
VLTSYKITAIILPYFKNLGTKMITIDDLIREAIELDKQIKNATNTDDVAELLNQLANVREEFWAK